ncbi:DUF3489 domain-containing protein [uncultured Sneathiella sp.]|uniref:DUF3489 domain-containing protein n=1 Tax=uncultured Sneathiella sp. TaxID=879315 RepID=UPI0030DD45B9|tara:strand:- start:3613 stop:3948 length:336 start_codon:yes stop_codon:yes gene_type:complete
MTASETAPQSGIIETKAEVSPLSKASAKEAAQQKLTADSRKRMKALPKKPDIILKLIKRSKGARMQDLQKATGWHAHSIRAALTGLRKQGIPIDRQKNTAGETIYKLMAEE